MSTLRNGRAARLDSRKSATVRSGTNTAYVKGKVVNPTDAGYLDWGEAHCGNCGATKDLTYSKGCELLLCGNCRKLRVERVRELPFEVRFERRLGMPPAIPGTYFPAEWGAE